MGKSGDECRCLTQVNLLSVTAGCLLPAHAHTLTLTRCLVLVTFLFMCQSLPFTVPQACSFLLQQRADISQFAQVRIHCSVNSAGSLDSSTRPQFAKYTFIFTLTLFSLLAPDYRCLERGQIQQDAMLQTLFWIKSGCCCVFSILDMLLNVIR